MTLSEKIKTLCANQGITLYRLEQDCGFGNGSIMKWEKSSPKVENIIKVANYFNVSVDYLLGRTDNSLPIKNPEYKLTEKIATDYKQPLKVKMPTTLERIFALIEQNGKSDYAISKEIGLKNSTLSEWRAGRAKPSVDAIIRLSKYFNVSSDHLLCLSNENSNPITVTKTTEANTSLDNKTNILGERLKQIRKEKNITQASIADYCNVSYQCYAGWEHGRHSPDPTNLVKIAEYLNVSLDYLLGRTDNALPIKRPEYALAEKFATDYKQLLTDKSFQDITAMCNEITDEQRALICGYVAGLLQNWGINVQSILQK